MNAKTILDFLDRHRTARIALMAHQRPDGDAIGSAVGLAAILRGQGFQADVVNARPIPERLSFVVPDDTAVEFTSSKWWSNYDCLGLLDCGEPDRLDPDNREAVTHLPCFTIDHHASSRGVGEATWIAPAASSTGEMIVELARQANWTISQAAAQALWVAIVTDTGRFSYENTTLAALAAGMTCLEAGANPTEAANHIYQSVSRSERRLQAKVLERMEFTSEGRLATSWLLLSDFEAADVANDGSLDLINLLRDTAGVEVAIFLTETRGTSPGDPAAVKASLRTVAPHNAISLVEQFGGGGHMRAAGCTLPFPMPEALATVKNAASTLFFGI